MCQVEYLNPSSLVSRFSVPQTQNRSREEVDQDRSNRDDMKDEDEKVFGRQDCKEEDEDE